MSSLVIATVNVNGLRAAARKGFVEWLAGTKADVVCLQETRAELISFQLMSRRLACVGACCNQGSCRSGRVFADETDAVRIGFGSAGSRIRGVTWRRTGAGERGQPVSAFRTGGHAVAERKSGSWRNSCLSGASAHQRGRAELAVCGDWNIAHQALLEELAGQRKN